MFVSELVTEFPPLNCQGWKGGKKYPFNRLCFLLNRNEENYRRKEMIWHTSARKTERQMTRTLLAVSMWERGEGKRAMSHTDGTVNIYISLSTYTFLSQHPVEMKIMREQRDGYFLPQVYDQKRFLTQLRFKYAIHYNVLNVLTEYV